MCAPLQVIAVTAVWSVKYLNRDDVLGNNVVVPVYYCTFTFFSVVGARSSTTMTA